ncbi:phytoene synthase [Roseovarius sp. A21]|uniref:Phytoene synthase n=1 Tax=Roseovarius bejariae TaxID=2576383 RepID=A0A844CZX9_9RHOB|nr:squalene/phytoene synthase family protein [Roseovarius bejariae]MRU14438.1 phytoene synthase [Roseovarius bejariae]
MEFDADLTACAALVEAGDAERFAAVMAAPVAARAKLFPLYAFNIEVSRAPWVTQEPMIAEMRLQWWRDALEEIRERGVVRRHEVVTPLAHLLSPEDTEWLDDLILARRWDIGREPFEDMAAFRRHIRDTSGGLLVVAGQALDRSAPAEVLEQAGFALGLANWLRAVPALEAAGRIPLVEGTAQAVRALAQEGVDSLQAARRGRGDIPPAARPALLPVAQAEAVLHRAASRPARVGEGTLDPAPIRRRLALMRAALTGRW